MSAVHLQRARSPVHRSKRRHQPEFGKIDTEQKASARKHERSECGSALGGVRIYRRGMRPEGRAPFQREWEPPFCPDLRAHDTPCQIDAASTDKSWHIPRRYKSFAETTALTLTSTAIVSFGVTVKNVGLNLDTALFWLAAWPVSAMIAVPLRLVLTPFVNRCIALFVEPPANEC